ncbi:MAG: hypothetical protein EBQ92_09055 [Proteobacteria bacterium]|nr:hypothetical protein [Pseudomonadota bacterium]
MIDWLLRKFKENIFSWGGCFFLLVGFSVLFMGRAPQFGHDYKYFLPHLVESADYTQKNWGIQYFTRFCGGFPSYGNPQSMQISLPGLLFLWLTPLDAMVVSVLLYCFLGYWGCYFFLRKMLDASKEVSANGALIFSCNGFFFSHILSGHFSYITFPLIPWVLLFLFESDRSAEKRVQHLFLALSVLMAGSFIYSGGYWTVLVLGFSIFYFSLFIFGIRPRTLLGFVGLIFLLGISKLNAFLDLHPLLYHNYEISESNSVTGAILSVFSALFLPPGLANYGVFNRAFGWWELSAFISPFVLFSFFLKSPTEETSYKTSYFRRAGHCALWGFLVLLAGGASSPARILSKIPFLSNYYLVARYASFFILPLIVWHSRKVNLATAFGFKGGSVALHSKLKTRYLWGISLGGLIVFLLGFSQVVFFWPSRRNRIDFDVRSVEYLPLGTIKTIEKRVDPILGGGAVALNCYEPLLGYRHEGDKRQLKEGPIETLTEGRFNFTHPACLVYPSLYQCERWSRVGLSEKDNLNRFLNNEDPAWKIPYRQSIANWISALTLLYLLGLAIRSSRHDAYWLSEVSDT